MECKRKLFDAIKYSLFISFHLYAARNNAISQMVASLSETEIVNGDSIDLFNRISSILNTEVTPIQIELFDVDLDGSQDIVCANRWSKTISVFLNDNNNFLNRVDINLNYRPYQIISLDINNDSRKDLIVASTGIEWSNGEYSPQIQIFINNSTENEVVFDQSKSLRLYDKSWTNTPYIKISDLNKDGLFDVITYEGWGSSIFKIFRNISVDSNDLQFQEKTIDLEVYGNYSFLISDLNYDDKPDLMFGQGGLLYVFTNESQDADEIIFKYYKGYNTKCSSFIDMSIGDLDGDNKNDVLILGAWTGGVSILKNISTSDSMRFKEETFLDINLLLPQRIYIGDANKDNVPDIIIDKNEQTRIYAGDRADSITFPEFSLTKAISSSSEQVYSVLCDIDNDKLPELIVVSETDKKITVYNSTLILSNKPLGIQDQFGNKVRLYPNPSQDFMTVEWDNFERASISELSGKELYNTNDRILDLRTLKAGVYLIALSGMNKKRLIFRIIKE